MWVVCDVWQGTGKWYELQDLQVIDILPQMITLSEAYIQVCCSLLPFDEGGLEWCLSISGCYMKIVVLLTETWFGFLLMFWSLSSCKTHDSQVSFLLNIKLLFCYFQQWSIIRSTGSLFLLYSTNYLLIDNAHFLFPFNAFLRKYFNQSTVVDLILLNHMGTIVVAIQNTLSMYHRVSTGLMKVNTFF